MNLNDQEYKVQQKINWLQAQMNWFLLLAEKTIYIRLSSLMQYNKTTVLQWLKIKAINHRFTITNNTSKIVSQIWIQILILI